MARRVAPQPIRHVDDDERRARLGLRQGLASGARFGDVVEATRAMTVLHATEPASVHLALHARVDGVTVADVEEALYVERSLVKQLAMRQTLFAFTRDLLPAAWGSASARLAGPLRTRVATDLVTAGVTTDGGAWLDEVADAVVGVLGDREASAAELRALVPELDRRIERGAGKWGQAVPLAPQVLMVLCAQGQVVRASNGGHWRLARPRYTATAHWLGEVPAAWEPRAGYAELVRRWLRTFGPGTEADLRWWLGGTLGLVRTALTDIDAVPVSLDGSDAVGWLLPEDVEPVEDAGEWVALLPTLDPTVMGWHGRRFYLGRHRDQLFDSVGNAGTTAWWNGRVVGVWVQDDASAVSVHPIADVPAHVRRMLDREARRLTDWLDGVAVTTIAVSPAMERARG